MKASKFSGYLALAFFTLAIGKMLIVLLANPLIAYSNNWDFIRVESCLGLYQNYADRTKTEAHKEGPVNDLILDGDQDPNLCLKSVDTVFPLAATFFHGLDDRVDFREIGLIRAVFLLAGIAAGVFVFRSCLERVTLALSFLLVFGDMAYLSYFNTLYTEFSVIAGVFFSLLAVSFLWTRNGPPSKAAIGFTFAALTVLGFSKQQYSPLASIFSILVAFLAFYLWKKRVLAVAFLAAGLLLPLMFGAIQGETDIYRAVQAANKTNTYLYAVLPYASDQAAALDTLGLPPSCAAGIGKSWFTPGLQQNHPCPEVLNVSRSRLLPLFVKQPVTFLKPIYRGVNESRPMLIGDLVNTGDASVASSLRYRSVRYSSLTTLLDALPKAVYALVIYLAMAAAAGAMLFTAIQLYRKRRVSAGDADRIPRRGVNPLAVLAALGGFTVFYAIATSVFGDGFAEVPKHSMALGVGLGCEVAAGFVWLMQRTVGKSVAAPDLATDSRGGAGSAKDSAEGQG